jgi:hypothetical protein
MKLPDLPIMILSALSTTALFISPLSAGERLGFPPADPPGTVRPAMTAETIQKQLDQQMQTRFEAAAGTSGKLTAQQARDAGWGFVADHFDEITKGKRKTVGLADIQAFMSVRSPLAAPLPVARPTTSEPVQPKPADNKPVQIIE